MPYIQLTDEELELLARLLQYAREHAEDDVAGDESGDTQEPRPLIELLDELVQLEGFQLPEVLEPILRAIADRLIAAVVNSVGSINVPGHAAEAIAKLKRFKGRGDEHVLFALGDTDQIGWEIQDVFGDKAGLAVVSFLELCTRAGRAQGAPGEPAPRPKPDDSGSGEPSHPGDGG